MATKKRKKKNVKMRRQIWKTVSAILMIMAIVVAAIPVERYGRMEAADVGDREREGSINDIYKLYMKYHKSNEYDDNFKFKNVSGLNQYNVVEPDASVDGKIVTISDEGDNSYSLNTTYYYKNYTQGSLSGGVIVYFNKSSISQGDTLEIGDAGGNMYKDYLVVTSELIDDFYSEIAGEQFSVKAIGKGDSKNVDITIPADGSNPGRVVSISIPETLDYSTLLEGSVSHSNKAVGVMNPSGTFYSTYYPGVQFGFTNLGDDVNLFTKYGDSITEFTSWKSTIDGYNTSISTYLSQAQSLVSTTANTSEQIADLATKADDLKSSVDSLTNNKPSELTVDGNKMKIGLNNTNGGLQNYFCKRIQIKSYTGGSFNLDGFTLTQISDNVHRPVGDNSYIYAPKWRMVDGYPNGSYKENLSAYDLDKSNADYRSPQVDDKGFLTTGTISVIGIGNEVFKDEGKITDVKLSDKIAFIGNDAFNGTKLKEISLAECKVVGNRAFANCSDLEKVNISGASLIEIGAGAFADTVLTEISLPNSVTDVGAGAFANTKLTKIDLQSSTINIWPFAFYNCTTLEDIKNGGGIPTGSGVSIGLGAFAVDDTTEGMAEFEFPSGMTKIIGTASSSNHYQASVEFKSYVDDDSHKAGDYIEAIENEDEIELMYDFILAGRKGLTYVTFPSGMGSQGRNKAKIPDNTLMHCNGLKCVTFGKLSYNDCSYGIEYNPAELFRDIAVSGFYVQGPACYKTNTESEPRMCTWKAVTNVSNAVPYWFIDENGKTRVEFAVGQNGEFLAEIELKEDGSAVLQKYKVNTTGTPGMIGELVINSELNDDYRINELGENCFDKIKDLVVTFTIPNGSDITKIGKNAFEGSQTLQRVNIGNSIITIEENAFANCKLLENVYFNKPGSKTSSDDWDCIQIDDTAFLTGSDYLTFHGFIDSTYSPYKYAMNKNRVFNANKTNKNICYRSDYDSFYNTDMEQDMGNLTVIIDRGTGLATCIDYPHYEEIDLMNTELIEDLETQYTNEQITYPSPFSIKNKWEEYIGAATTNQYSYFDGIDNRERNTVMATLTPVLPNGIESIDTVTFFENNDNSDNATYFNRFYEKEPVRGTDEHGNSIVLYYEYKVKTSNLRNINPSGKDDVKRLYSDKTYVDEIEPYAAGLFGAYFEEGIRNKMISETDFIFQSEDITRNMVEEKNTGNDNLLKIDFYSVTDLPDYAFNSCENLIYANLGDALGNGQELSPVGMFRNCRAINAVYFGNDVESNNYIYSNGIIYRKLNANSRALNESGTQLEIVEVLETRGDNNMTEPFNISSKVISPDNDPLLNYVVSITDEAFTNNKNISTVDLSTTKIKKIPKQCFSGDSKLSSVFLPATLDYVGDEAFKDCELPLRIQFENQQASFGNNVFSGSSEVYLEGEAFADSEKTHDSSLKLFAESNSNVTFVPTTPKYKVRLFDYDADLLAILTVKQGDSIKTDADEVSEKLTRVGYTFTCWAWDKDGDLTTSGDTITDREEVLSNITQDRVLVAQYKANTVVGDGQEHTLTVKNGIINTTGQTTGKIKGGAAVSATAYAPAANNTFLYWSSDEIAISDTNKYSTVVSFIMPNADATLTATYRDANGNITTDDNASTGKPGGSNSGSSGTGGSNSDNNDDKDGKYKLTVNYGSGSGNYDAGKSVTITAYAPEAKNKVFSHWSTSSSEVAFASTTSATTTLVMPKKDVTVTANYKTRSSSDDDDDDDDDDRDAWNKRHDSASATTNRVVNTGNSNGNGATGTGNNAQQNTTASDTGTKLDITANGISNRDVSSASVSGSTDNFVIKISDSADAKAAVEAALIDKYGSLDGLAYFPMDISLYDPSGKNKVIDTSGLSVSITIPIPDELIQYGGNNLAGAVNSANKMEDLVARFTTIDGIGCITFTATHFSPYAIYVDTNNLVAGQTMDATPKTGDGIHPKWFLAIALACMSIAVFMVSDKKKVRTAI